MHVGLTFTDGFCLTGIMDVTEPSLGLEGVDVNTQVVVISELLLFRFISFYYFNL